MADTPKQDADAALDRAATQSRDGRPGALPIQDPLRHDVWPQWQYVRLHAVRGSEHGREPLDDDLDQPTTHARERRAGRSRVHGLQKGGLCSPSALQWRGSAAGRDLAAANRVAAPLGWSTDCFKYASAPPGSACSSRMASRRFRHESSGTMRAGRPATAATPATRSWGISIKRGTQICPLILFRRIVHTVTCIST